MKSVELLRSATLVACTLLAVGLTNPAHAAPDQGRRSAPLTISPVFHRGHVAVSERHEHRQHAARHHRDGRHEYDEDHRRHHRPLLIRHQAFEQPRLVIQLPWLVFVHY